MNYTIEELKFDCPKAIAEIQIKFYQIAMGAEK